MEFPLGLFNLYLLAFSVIIQLVTSYTAYNLYLKYIYFKIDFHWFRLFCSALILGLGISCMNFIGTLAYQHVNLMKVDVIFVAGSLFLSIGGSYLALVSLRRRERKYRVSLSSFIMVATLVTIQFVEILSIREDIILDRHYLLVSVAVFLTFLSLYFSFRWIGNLNSSKEISFKLSAKCGILTGVGISVFYFIKMISVMMSPIQSNEENGTNIWLSMDITLLAISLGFSTLIVLLLVVIDSYIEREFLTKTKYLKINEQYYQSLFDYNPDIVIIFDVEGYFLSANKVVEEYGFTREELINSSFLPLIVPEFLDHTIDEFQKARKGTATTYESAFFNKYGERVELTITNIPIILDEEVIGIYGIVKDITDYKLVQKTLIEAELKYRNLVEESLTGIYIVQDNRFVYVNPQLLHIFGYTYDEVVGENVSKFIHPDDIQIVQENIQKRLTGETKGIRYYYKAIKKDQEIMYLEVYGSGTMYKGRPAIIGSVIDRTEQKTLEDKIQQIAYYDFLTDLPNRYQFNSLLQKALTNEQIKTGAILFINLDNFKLVNDTFGHDTGDLILKEVSKRLKDCIRPSDSLARNGGDEFILFYSNVDHLEVSNLAIQLVNSLNQVIHLNQYEIYITPSIGISSYPQDGKDMDTLVKKANMALQHVKQTGKNGYRMYINHIMEFTNEGFELEIDLRKAIRNEEFVLYYQPKFDIQSGNIIGMEALIRWQHPEKGLIPPSRFIPLAEETGLIVEIGEWVLRNACMQMKDLHDKGYPPMVISVNLSLRQFFQRNLIGLVSQILNETKLSPEFLELEITERMMIDTDQSLGIVNELKHLGVLISLDDFGTGYSSLHYLKKFPIDIIKIDHSFISGCLTDGNDAVIVKTIIAMAHNLNMEVIAEGIESIEQLTFLQQNICDVAQGYLFSEPLSIMDFINNFDDFLQVVHRLSNPQDTSN
ncbi:EAL domain-containing protein [Robertmurraya korlensis]|uniref:EAL domain-containing protein n=1 Tax=Robertmurraya korlensis TaxID=519977 RepID=UPI00082586B1|nr:EAL domain-containing protein [Robertmurraya korlensis]